MELSGQDDSPAESVSGSPANPAAPSPWLQGLRGAWLMLFGVLCYSGSLELGLSLSQKYSLADYPGANPPWYFIRQDAIQGAVALAGLALTLAVAWMFRRKYPMYATMLAALNVISMSGSAWRALVIFARCPHLMDPTRAVSAWPTFDAYLGDRVILAGQVAGWVAGMLIALWMPAWMRRARPDDPKALSV